MLKYFVLPHSNNAVRKLVIMEKYIYIYITVITVFHLLHCTVNLHP